MLLELADQRRSETSVPGCQASIPPTPAVPIATLNRRAERQSQRPFSPAFFYMCDVPNITVDRYEQQSTAEL
jgi:hypothetical protein